MNDYFLFFVFIKMVCLVLINNFFCIRSVKVWMSSIVIIKLVKINSGIVSVWKNLLLLLFFRCKLVVVSVDMLNEKFQNEVLNGWERYYGIRCSINSSCSSL